MAMSYFTGDFTGIISWIIHKLKMDILVRTNISGITWAYLGHKSTINPIRPIFPYGFPRFSLAKVESTP